jgi:hypothetical protein
MAHEIRNRAELKRRRELMRVAIERRAAERLAASRRDPPAAPHAVVAPQPTMVAAPSTMVADSATPVVLPSPSTVHKVEAWLQEHAAAHGMRFTEVVTNRGDRAWNIDCDACGTTMSKVVSSVALERHVKTAKHVNALSASEDPETRVVQHRMKNKVDDWLQQHAARHKMRFTEVVAQGGARVWNVDCDACGATLRRVRGVTSLEGHLKTAAHLGATLSSAPGTRERKRPRS